MKAIYLLILAAVISLTACNKDFLDKQPLASVSEETFFKKASDFKVYVNNYYDGLGDYTGFSIGPNDLGTDNQVDMEPNEHLNGRTVKPSADPEWSNPYEAIRGLNIMLTNTGGVDFDQIKPYVGEARFFRAFQYFQLLKRFGGVPWINVPLTPQDREALKAPRQPRNVLADSILADLDTAIAYLPSKSDAEAMRINKEVALALKSRVALYEGTWEKYHGQKGTVFKVEGADGTAYLQMAADAAWQVIQSGQFSVEKIGMEPYFDFFAREDFSASTEVMLWRKNDRTLRQWNVERQIYIGGGTGGLTKNLIESYLAIDGQPISLTNLEISDDSLAAVVQNRDPRLAQSIYYTGEPRLINDATGAILDYFIYTDLTRVPTGYQYRKKSSLKSSVIGANNIGQQGHIYFRYAEVLLNYIEAKSELDASGDATLTQADIDETINSLRDRVGMPHLSLAVPITDPDNTFTGDIPWYLVEIRRERRIELAVEGYRRDDIMRWAAADKLIKGKVFLGAPFQWYVDRGFYEATGQIRHVDQNGILCPWFETDIYTQGGYGFNLDRDYLYPVPLQQELLAGYTNNPGW
ncbi:MAG: RagB/SusD family nutrient uptake outer membrane protein [Agriterribacter sp.]